MPEAGTDRAPALLDDRLVAALRGLLRDGPDPGELCGLVERGGSLEELAEKLRDSGISVRAVKITRSDITSLALPAIVSLTRGFALVRRVNGPWIRFEIDGKQITLRSSEIARELRGDALELVPSRPEAVGAGGLVLAAVCARRKWLVLASIVALLVNLVAMAPPLVVGLLIDKALPDGSSSLVRVLAIAIVFATVYQAAFGLVRDGYVRAVSAQCEHLLRRWLLDHILSLTFQEQQKRSLAVFTQAFHSLDQFSRVLLEVTVPSLLDLTLVLAAVIGVATIHSPSAGVTAVCIVLAMVVATRLARRQAYWQDQEMKYQSEHMHLLTEIVFGLETVRLGGLERDALAGWMIPYERELHCRLRRRRCMVASELIAALPGTTYVLTLVWCSAQYLEGALSMGQVFAATGLSAMASGSGARICSTLGRFMALGPLSKRVQSALNGRVEPRVPKCVPQATIGPALRAEQVWFRYSVGDRWIVAGASLEVRLGEQLRIPGRSGSGKTTLIRLIAGCLNPERGSVRIFGGDTRSMRHLIAYLPQHSRCFQGTIRENLEIYSGGANWTVIRRACEQTGLSEFVSHLPMGYETSLPPGGSSLSGGERQLVLLTACVASPRPIVLLDEAFAHMDLPLQRRLRAQNLFAGRAVIYVDHDEPPAAHSEPPPM